MFECESKSSMLASDAMVKMCLWAFTSVWYSGFAVVTISDGPMSRGYSAMLAL